MCDRILHLDLRGLKCPLPVMKIRKALARMSPGEQLTADATDPVSVLDIPHFCHEEGHKLLEQETLDLPTADSPILRFVIRKA